MAARTAASVYHDTHEGRREPDGRDRALDGRRLDLGQPDHHDQRHEQQTEAGQRGLVGRRRRVVLAVVTVLVVLRDRQEEVPVPDGLREHERRVQRERRQCREGELCRGELGSRLAGGERGQHEAERGEGGHGRERGTTALGVEQRDVEPPRPDQERDADDPGGGQHERGENGVPGQRCRALAAGHHERDDQGHLDHGDRHREHERPERLPHPVRDDLGVVHRREHGRGEHDGDEHDENGAEVPPPGQCESHHTEQGHQSSPSDPTHHPTLTIRSVDPLGTRSVLSGSSHG
jgi:hypothetical protein